MLELTKGLWRTLTTPERDTRHKFFISRPFRIIYLAGNSFQIFEFKGVICKIFRNKELAGLASSQDFRREGLDSRLPQLRVVKERRLVGLGQLRGASW